jgi:hypothetical protein
MVHLAAGRPDQLRHLARAVELALPEHGKIFKAVPVSEDRIDDDLLDLGLPNPPLVNVQINHKPACIAGRSVPVHLVANCLGLARG